MGRSPKNGRLPEDRHRRRRRNRASKTLNSADAVRDSGGPSASRTAERDVYAAWAVCGFLVLAVAMVFGQTINYDFVNYDDDIDVYENPAIRHGLSAEGIHWALTTRYGSQWAPVTWMSYLVDYQIYGLKPWGYHLTNVILHITTTILLFLVLWRMTGELWPCAFVAAVFAIHPLHVESVAWVAERKGLLSGLFFVLTLGAYLHYVLRQSLLVRSLAYLAMLLSFALGLMSKPMLVTLPFVLLLLDYWPLGRMAAKQMWRLIAEKIPLLLLTVASCVLSPWAQGKAVIALEKLPLSARIDNALVSCVAYLGETFWPANLAVFYPHPGMTLPTWKLLAALLILLGITALVLVRWRRNPYLPVGWLWYLGMLVPVIGLVQIGSHAMADRYMYLPQIGLCLVLTWGTLDAVRSWSHRTWIGGAAALLAFVGLLVCARQQTTHWRDSEALWTHTLACTSHNYMAHASLGLTLKDQKRFDEAIKHFQAALDLEPHDAKRHYNLGLALAIQGRTDEAIKHFRDALRIEPDGVDAHVNLGLVLLSRARLDEAKVEFQLALDIQADCIQAHSGLAEVLAKQGKVDEAIEHIERVVEIDPDYVEARSNLGFFLASRGRLDEAIKHCQKALQLKPDFAAAHFNYGIALARLGRIDEAMTQFRTALALARQQNNQALAEAVRAKMRLFQAGIPNRKQPSILTPPAAQPERSP